MFYINLIFRPRGPKRADIKFCFSYTINQLNLVSTDTTGDPGLIPRSGRSPGEGIGYPLQYSWACLVAQLVKKPPAMRETWVRSLGWEDPLRRE